MPDIVVIGEALIDLFAEPGKPLAKAASFTPRFGGAPANVAVAAARLGGNVGFLGKVGEDGFGDALTSHLAGFGIDVSHLTTSPNPTMLACVALPGPGEPDFVLFSGANADLAVDDIDEAYLAAARVMAFGSVSLAYQSETAVLHAARLARDSGLRVVFDVNLRPSIWPDLELARRRIGEAIALSSVVQLNHHEARFLFGEMTPEDAAAAVMAMGPDLCCISRGSKGAYFRNRSGDGHVPGYAVDVVDTTGCGDAFLAGMVVSLAGAEAIDPANGDVGNMVAFANACGAVNATQLGGMEADLRRSAVDALVANGAGRG